MNIDKASVHASADNEYPWFRDGSMPRSREDRIAEAVALAALVFSLGVGLVIALLPVSSKAAPSGAPSTVVSAPAAMSSVKAS